MVRRVALAALLAAGACVNDGAEAGVDQAPTTRDALSPVSVLNRASLDVRGIRPSPRELQAVAADPEALQSTIDAFVDDAAFGDRIKDIFAGAWRTRVDFYPLPVETDGEDNAALFAAIGEEPLNLIAYIAVNDLPLTRLLESTDTFVAPVLADAWDLQVLPDDGSVVPEGLVRARYSDGRPLAGVLSMNAVFWRHSSTVENANRGRANALSQALLCQSYLDRPIDFPADLDLTDSESIRTAIATNPACQGCHSTLDPFASYLWGYMYGETEQPIARYSLEQERAWQIYTNAAPAFFGKGGERLVDLAAHVAGDERFVGCAVRRVYEGMLGRKATLADEGALAEHREVFLANDLSLKSLVRSVLADPSYHGQSWQPRFGGEPEAVYEKVAPPSVVASSLADLSGYALTYDGRSASSLDIALRTLAGGSDRGDTTNVSTGAVLVQRRLAEAGALFAVDAAAMGQDNPGRLGAFLAGRDLDAAPTTTQLAELVTLVRTQAIAEDDAELEALLGVWTDVAAIEDPHAAWVAVVTATLADPDHLLY